MNYKNNHKVEVLSITDKPDECIEQAARNTSQTELKESNRYDFIMKLKELGHDSVFEFADAMVRFKCSFACEKQVIRSRLASFAIESFRRLKDANDLEFIVPISIKKNDILFDKYNKLIEMSIEFYNECIGNEIPAEDARYGLLMSTITNIVMKANFREWIKIFSQRLTKFAQWEIKGIMKEIERELAEYSVLFKK